MHPCFLELLQKSGNIKETLPSRNVLVMNKKVRPYTLTRPNSLRSFLRQRKFCKIANKTCSWHACSLQRQAIQLLDDVYHVWCLWFFNLIATLTYMSLCQNFYWESFWRVCELKSHLDFFSICRLHCVLHIFFRIFAGCDLLWRWRQFAQIYMWRWTLFWHSSGSKSAFK